MIESILITNHLGDSIALELRFPEKSGFLVKRVDGLGPTKATINTIKLATRDGSLYNSGHINERNIVFNLQLVNNSSFSDSIEDVRQRSYKYFPVKRMVELQIQTNTRVCKIVGYIETNEIDIFSREVSSQISIICPNPFFSDLESTLLDFSSVASLFEFPFSNESLASPLIEISEILPNTLANIYYDGDVETGLLFKIHALGNVENITIYNETTLGTFKINTDVMVLLTDTGIVNGDDIFISTVKGNKYALLFREGVYINILNFIDPDPEWFSLNKGDNVFGFIADSGIEHLQFKIEYTNLYEGV